eukprot:1338991-Rhodomonas_salina.1
MQGSDTRAVSWESEGTSPQWESPYLSYTCTNYEHNGTISTCHNYRVEYRATALSVPDLQKGMIQHDHHSRPGSN